MKTIKEELILTVSIEAGTANIVKGIYATALPGPKTTCH